MVNYCWLIRVDRARARPADLLRGRITLRFGEPLLGGRDPLLRFGELLLGGRDPLLRFGELLLGGRDPLLRVCDPLLVRVGQAPSVLDLPVGAVDFPVGAVDFPVPAVDVLLRAVDVPVRAVDVLLRAVDVLLRAVDVPLSLLDGAALRPGAGNNQAHNNGRRDGNEDAGIGGSSGKSGAPQERDPKASRDSL